MLFTRDPLTGDSQPFGEWLPRGHGEDVVSGTQDPLPFDALAKAQPAVHEQLVTLAMTLERAGRDVQDIEFTVESGRLWLLRTRSAERSPAAAVRWTVALAQEGLISESEAMDQISSEQVAAVLRLQVGPHARTGARVLATGRSACPGVAS